MPGIRFPKAPNLALALACGWVLSACGGASGPAGDGGNDGCTGSGQRLLSVVGDPNRALYVGEQTSLQVVLLEKCVGAVAGETVVFEPLGETAGSTLSAAQAATADNGLAGVSLTAGAQTASFQVWAHHPADPDGVYFSIQVKPRYRQLYPVGPTSLEASVGERLSLVVKLLEVDTNQPVRGVAVRFAIVDPAGGDGALDDGRAVTNLSGQADVVFRCGTAPTTYQVVAEGEAEEVGRVTFNLRVKPLVTCDDDGDCPPGSICQGGYCRDTGGTVCTTDDQCPEGYVCQSGVCRPEGTLPDTCTTSADCPQGYFCENHACYPCEATSDLPECEGGLACHEDIDCPGDFECRDGVCQRLCNPATCSSLHAECGAAADGCGGVLDCGSCSAPESCGGGGVPHECGCTPNCTGRECGSNGCFDDCGSCWGNTQCNTASGHCEEVCDPQDCYDLGKDCGNVPDGCGGSNECGSCSAPESCGGGGLPNVCGCTPQCVGRQCGPDGCGDDCGTCDDVFDCSPEGQCVPQIPDVERYWWVDHYFDLRGALPEVLQQLAGPMDLLDRWINECDFTGIGLIDDFLCDLVDEYVPDWVGTVIHILNSMYWIMSEMWVDADLELIQINPPELVTGTEEWDNIYVRFLDACCMDELPPCDPHAQPDFPDCATVDITVDDMIAGDVGFEVLPFTGRVLVDTSVSPPRYTLRIDPRQVRIEYSAFVAFVLDELIDIFTGYDSLDDAIMDIIDCEGLQDLIEEVFGNDPWIPDITGVCEGLKPSIIAGIRGLLDQIGVGWKVMRFAGQGTISTYSHGPPIAYEIGFVDHETSHDGNWDGTFDVVLEGPLTGTWYAN